MKKTVLALLIGSTLVGCGSDSDNQPSQDLVSATLMDVALVSGVTYQCGIQSGTTDAEGNFNVKKGTTNCVFSIGELSLGQSNATITETNNQVSTLTLKPTVTARTVVNHVANVSALLQTVDANNDIKDGIDLTKVVSTSIPATILQATDDKAFDELVSQVKIEIDGEEKTVKDLGIETVAPSKAGAELNNTYKSENVDTLIKDVKKLAVNDDFTKVDFDAKLNEYRDLLKSGSDDSNGYHQKALLAMIEILEVSNMQEVSERLKITNPSSSEMLANLLEVALNPKSLVELSLNEAKTGSTDDINIILNSAAVRLANASNELATAFPNKNYVMQYGEISEDEAEFSLTYQDAQIARSYALALASTLNLVASYEKGSDANLMPQTEELTVDVVEFSNGEIIEKEMDLKAEFSQIESNPLSLLSKGEIGQFNAFAEANLKEAKAWLTEAIEIAKWVDLSDLLDKEEAAETAKIIADLSQHLADENSSFLSEDADKEQLYINLHALFSTAKGIDVTDINIANLEYQCERNWDGTPLKNSQYSETLSKLFNETVCSHEEDNHHWNVFDNIAVKASYSQLDFPDGADRESSSSTIEEVIWCGQSADGQKVSCFDEQ
ncbi:hypothetical protein [Shewanella sp. 30m-9]